MIFLKYEMNRSGSQQILKLFEIALLIYQQGYFIIEITCLSHK